jgi:predicted ABC-type ATPase
VSSPILIVLAGPNGAGKTTLYERVLARHIDLEFVNERRAALLEGHRSFVTETVFSHASKLELMQQAADDGYLVALHVVVIPEELAVARVVNRVEHGGHDVPEDKVRARYGRLWGHVRQAIDIADETSVYDNSSARSPLRPIARYRFGELIGTATWPTWAPADLGSA